MPHFCHEELFAILAAIPVLKFVGAWLRLKLKKVAGAHECECPAEMEERCADADGTCPNDG